MHAHTHVNTDQCWLPWKPKVIIPKQIKILAVSSPRDDRHRVDTLTLSVLWCLPMMEMQIVGLNYRGIGTSAGIVAVVQCGTVAAGSLSNAVH